MTHRTLASAAPVEVSGADLIVLLYQGCLRFIGHAREAMGAGDYDVTRVNFLKAQDIVAELMGSLNMDASPMSANLMRLYDYIHRRLIEANIRRDDSAAAEVAQLLSSLLSAWEEAARLTKVEGAALAFEG